MSRIMTRRQFVRASALGVGATAVVPALGTPVRAWRFFTDFEAALVEAIAAQIIPTDQDPGAREAGVVNFIDKQLIGSYERFQPIYRVGLAGLEETCLTKLNRSFLALADQQQTDMLRLLESGKATGKAWGKTSPAAFFSLIRDHAMQGFYGGPQHGGNRGYVSYRMLGLDYPQIIGQNRYRKA
jgi:gluconate 2-dehydrogenase gamma chain